MQHGITLHVENKTGMVSALWFVPQMWTFVSH